MGVLKDWLLKLISIKPTTQIKDSEGVITNYYRNGTVSVTKCLGVKCSECECKS